MNPQTLVGRELFYKNKLLGIIVEALYGHVPWSHSQEWRFKLDNGAWLRDVRKALAGNRFSLG